MRLVWSRGRALAGVAVSVVALSALIQGCTTDDGAPLGPAERLGRDTNTRWIVDVDLATGAADLVVAVDAIPATAGDPASYEAAARAFVERYKDLFRLDRPADQLALDEVIVGGDGTGHVLFAQREGGLRVERARLGVHFRDDGSIGVVEASIAPEAAKAVASPRIDADRAIANAERELIAEIPGYSSALLTHPPEPKLVLAARGASAVLGWRFVLEGRDPAGEPFGRSFLVDARTGDIEQSFSSHADLTATGQGVHGDEKSFTASRKWIAFGDYQLVQPGGFGRTKVTTFDANQDDQIVSSSKRDEWDRVEVGAGAAVDAHAYVTGADAYFRRYHGWASYNGWGAAIRVYAHDNSMPNNAWWDGRGGLHFSDGNSFKGGTQLPRSAGPDTVGHELMHGITQHTAGLEYVGQSGALNESFSDIFGSYVEAEIKPGSRFEHGDQNGSVLRDLANPTAKNQPDHMSIIRFAGEAPAKGNDWGGVHYNSGIPNNAWYLMANGGQNATSKVPVTHAIGLDPARKLWWATVRYLLGSGSQFDVAARRQLAWARITRLPVESVGCAWVATGVLTREYVKDRYGVECVCEAPDGGVVQPDEMQCCPKGKPDACCKPCEPGEPGEPSKPSEATKEPDLFDSCKGRADGVYCSQLASYSAIVCQGESIALGVQCEGEAKCIGPNGPGSTVACEGKPATPPKGGKDGGAPAGPDSCDGRPDGIYCSSLAAYSAFECQGGTIALGHQCPDGKTCKGPNGPGALVCQ